MLSEPVSLIFKHSDTKWGGGETKHSRSNFRGGAPVAPPSKSATEFFTKLSGTWLSRGSYVVLHGCYGVSAVTGLRPAFYRENIALRCSYVTCIRKGATSRVQQENVAKTCVDVVRSPWSYRARTPLDMFKMILVA